MAMRTRVPKKPKAICPVCGKEFERTHSAQVYCSRKCRQINANVKGYVPMSKPLKDMTCKWCGSVFQAAYKRKYCTITCRDIANGSVRQKPAEREEPKMTLEQIAVASREEGLSYGEYVRKYGL